MSVSNIFLPGGFEVETADISPKAFVGGITSYDIVEDVQVIREFTDGRIHPFEIGRVAASESIRATTMNIDDAIDIVGAQGTTLQGDSGLVDGLSFYLYQQDKATGGIASGSVHKQYKHALQGASTPSGMFIPVSIEAAHQANASMTVQAITQGDGSGGAGIVKTDGVAFPANLEDDGERFTVGPLTIDGNTYDGKKNVSIDFGVSVFTESADSEIYPSHVAVSQILSLITIRGIDPNWLGSTNAARAGEPLTHSNSTLYFKKRTDTAFEADGSAVHIKLTIFGYAWVTTLATGNASAPSETVLQIFPAYDISGSTAPITLNTSQAIT